MTHDPSTTNTAPGKTALGDPAHGSVGHVVPFKTLLSVFLALTLLTIITVAASTINFGEFNLIVALAIAVIKASLVVLYFMHLRWDKPFNSIVFIGCLIFVSLFISLSLLDSHQYRHSVIEGQAAGVPHKPLTPESVEQAEHPQPAEH
jgi:cytochrome c oxidase subunit 4